MGTIKTNTLFSIISATPYDLETGLPYGHFDVPQGGKIDIAPEKAQILARGGQVVLHEYVKSRKNMLSLDLQAIPDFGFNLYMGGNMTTLEPSATWEVSPISSVKGTLVGANGILNSATITTPTKKYYGDFILKAVAPSELVCYPVIQLTAGEAETSPINVGQVIINPDGNTIIEEIGVTLNGAAAVNMNIGDTARLTTTPPHGGGFEFDLEDGAELPEHGLVLLCETGGTRQFFQVTFYKVKGTLSEIPIPDGDYAKFKVDYTFMKDSETGKIMQIKSIEKEL